MPKQKRGQPGAGEVRDETCGETSEKDRRYETSTLSVPSASRVKRGKKSSKMKDTSGYGERRGEREGPSPSSVEAREHRRASTAMARARTSGDTFLPRRNARSSSSIGATGRETHKHRENVEGGNSAKSKEHRARMANEEAQRQRAKRCLLFGSLCHFGLSLSAKSTVQRERERESRRMA